MLRVDPEPRFLTPSLKTELGAAERVKGPNIIHAFAVEKGYYGYIWKIYLEAKIQTDRC